MRKGLVVTLGVALVLAVAPSFAEAPLLSCIPDIVISDFDAGQTADQNLFVFQDALNLDEYVTDADTPDNMIKWSFIETTGDALRFNGITEISSPASALDPGANNIRLAANGLVTIENVQMTSAATEPMVSAVVLYASDGTTVTSEAITVTTVNTDNSAGSQGDALVAPTVKEFTFATGAEGWTWASITGYDVPNHQAANGSLEMTEAAGPHTNVVYGGYESSKDPAQGMHPKVGCILRARVQMRSNAASGVATPGFRIRVFTGHMVQFNGEFVPDFTNQDYLDEQQVQFSSLDFAAVGNREPGASGKTYTMLYYPQQVPETLLAPNVTTFFAVEMLDTEGGNDAGTLFVDDVKVDAIDRPELGAGTAIDAWTTTSFVAASWNTGTNKLDNTNYNGTGLTVGVQSGALAITVASGNQWFESYAEPATGINLTPGNYYRFAWMVTSTESSENFGPRVRVAIASERFVWIAFKELAGGALLARFDTTPKLMEMWAVAPTADPQNADGKTEGTKPRFESWLTTSNTGFPFFKTVAGTVRAVSVTTEEFQPIP